VRYSKLNSFTKSLQKLSPDEKKRVRKALGQLSDVFESQVIPSGLGLKKLSSSLWELRVSLQLRVVFILNEDLVEWGFAGTHDDILKFIKHNK